MNTMRRLLLTLLALALVVPLPAAAGKKKERREAIEALAPKYLEWVQAVEVIIGDEELDAFLALEKDYQRDAFIEQFWRSRDPFPDSARNEYKERWEARLREAKTRFGRFDDPRAHILLTNGPPAVWEEISCGATLWPTEVWYYRGSETVNQEFFVVFYTPLGHKKAKLWEPFDGVRDLFQAPYPGAGDYDLLREIDASCLDSDILLAALSTILQGGNLGYPMLLSRILQKPDPPSAEWLATFGSYSTDLADEVDTFEAELSFEYPGSHQSRTVVQGAIRVPVEVAGRAQLAGSVSFDFLVTGELLREDRLFDRFRFKFHFQEADVVGNHVDLVFERMLRPGTYQALVKTEDLNGSQFNRQAVTIEVPRVDPVRAPDAETDSILDRAEAALSGLQHTVQIVPPRGEMQVGNVRFEVLTTGDGIAAVEFALDDRPIFKKQNPPFSVDLELGRLPHSQVLTAAALDETGRELARDRLVLNASVHRFAVELLEPRSGATYHDALRAVAEVEVPEGETVERVEIFLDETLVAALYQPPYQQVVRLPEPGALAYVRAVAYLPDGNSTEDLVFFNSPDGLEEIEIQLVELYTTVLGADGRPVEGLRAEEFRVFEDEVPQEIRRFELVRDLPIHAAILLDSSASMEDRIDLTRQAALSFFQDTVTPKDRAALFTFNDHPQLVVKFTNEVDRLAGGLAGLKAERGTALYDSVVYALYYFNGIKGRKALLLLSDGKDEVSRFEWDEALEFVQRAGVTLYTIGLDIPKRERDARKKLSQLAEETGGRSFFVDDEAALVPVYAAIEQELRSQYLLAYQSTNSAGDRAFRLIDVEVDRPDTEAKTLRGYFPR